VQGELFSWGDGSITVPGLDSLFWCPVQKGADYQRPQPYGLAENDCIRLVVDFDDLSSISCSIYVDYSDGVYTLRPVGEGVYLEQKGEGKALLSFDRVYAHPDSTATDIPAEVPAGSLWEYLHGLSIENVKTVSKRGDAFVGLDISAHQEFKYDVIIALNSLAFDDIRSGRGAPNECAITYELDDGSNLRLGYCGDFVELQLGGEAAEKYPAKGPVWEIHNEDLNGLFSELVNRETGAWNTEAAEIFGESKIYSYGDMKSAIDLVLKYMSSNPPRADVKLLRLGYEEEISLQKATAFAKQYGAQEAIVLVSDFEVGESWGAFSSYTTYENYEWVLVRDKGEDWILQIWDHG